MTPMWFARLIDPRQFDPRPRTLAFAREAQEHAPRDAGWVEVFEEDGSTKIGRGRLMLWPVERSSGDGPAEVDPHAAQPTEGDAPGICGELRSFSVEGDPPAQGRTLIVRPEREQDQYAITAGQYETDSDGGGGVLGLDWPDDVLPASLRELGGN